MTPARYKGNSAVLVTLGTLITSPLPPPAAEMSPAPVSGKLMLFTSFATSLVLFNSYSGMLVSILTTMTPRLPFTDFEGLLQHPEWNLGVRTNTALADALAVSISVEYIINGGVIQSLNIILTKI